MNCKECPYFWADRNEANPSCKYKSLGSFDPYPCEQWDLDRYNEACEGQ